MNITIRSAVAAALLGAVSLGLAGAAGAAPLNDPKGICSSPNADGMCVYGYAGPSHSVDVTIPADNPQEQAIVDYVGKAIDDFEADAGPHGTLDNPLPLEDLTISSTQSHSAATHSVVLTLDQMVRGAAHPADWYRTFVWNDAAKAPVTFDTLFRPGTAPLDVIAPIVAQQLSAQAGQPLTIDPSDGMNAQNYQNFAITDDAVVFYFDRDQMHPAMGATQVSVPRSAIAGLLVPGL
jgi:hypothetical protein